MSIRSWFVSIAGAAAFCAALLAAATDSPLIVAGFSTGSLEGWEPKGFRGETQYTLREGGLCALSRAAASGMFRRVPVDLHATPVLRWSWRVDTLPPARDERSKPGDDYAARVYVVFSGGALFWRTRAINYVWSASQPAGAEWPNAFTGNARMIAVRGTGQQTGVWTQEQRDVRADYRRLFGADIDQADAVAIMTDTDNGGGDAAACYGDIAFFAG